MVGWSPLPPTAKCEWSDWTAIEPIVPVGERKILSSAGESKDLNGFNVKVVKRFGKPSDVKTYLKMSRLPAEKRARRPGKMCKFARL